MTFTLEAEALFHRDRVIKRFRHERNSLRVIHLDHDAAPLVSYQTWMDVGSAKETTDGSGLAHFCEHLMFTGTKLREQGVFDREIEICGGDTNAATWLDWTYYRDSVPSDRLKAVIELESDRFSNLLLEPEIVESEREVILNERRERVDDDVDGFLDERLMSLAFGDHPYGRPTIGSADDIASSSLEDLEAFYHHHYAADNATIVVVGDVREDELLDLIERHYGHLSPSSMATKIERATPPTAARREVYEKPISASRALMGWVAPGQRERDWAVLDLISQLLTGGPSSRLYRDLVIERELASSVSCAILPLQHAGLFEIVVHAAGDRDVTECEPVIEGALGTLASNPIDERELAKVKTGMLTDFWSELTTADGKAESLGHHELVCGDFRELLSHPQTIASINQADIQRVCNAVLSTERCCEVVAIPE